MQYPNFQGQSLLSHVCVFLLLRSTSCRVKQICVRIGEVRDDTQFTGGDRNSTFIEKASASKNSQSSLPLYTCKVFHVKWLFLATVMVSCALLILCPLWIHSVIQACRGEDLSREAVVSWFRGRILEGLRLEEPPVATAQGPDEDMPQLETRHRRAPRISRTTWVNHQSSPVTETSQIILFPSSGKKSFR